MLEALAGWLMPWRFAINRPFISCDDPVSHKHMSNSRLQTQPVVMPLAATDRRHNRNF